MSMIIKQNPDKKQLIEIVKAVADNDGYCPCKLAHTDENLCMCEDFRKQEEAGFCHCGRYYKVQQWPIVTLCGSTKFKDSFIRAREIFTRGGWIVLGPEIYKHTDHQDLTDEEIQDLNDIHFSKIEMADVVFIVNEGGYIGEQTQKEIEWATELNKKIVYMEDKGE